MRTQGIYLINEKTKAIVTIKSDYYKTIIYEKDREIKSPFTATKILEESCIRYGASLKGRRATSKYLLNTNEKLPVAVDRDNGIYLFPTSALRSGDCVWLAYFHIKKIKKSDDKTYIKFKGGMELFINASYYTIDKQKKNTSELIVQLNLDKLF